MGMIDTLARYSGASAAVPGKPVYIVDDDSMVRRALSFSLGTNGYATRAFASGRDFLDALDELAPGCVLLDIRMPAPDGLEVLALLGAKAERFGVIAMTGHGDIDTAVRAMKRGAQDFLEKPFADADLVMMIETLFALLPSHVEADTERCTAVARVAALTARERDVLGGLVAGQSNKAMAHRLGLSVRTVEMHRGRLMDHLGASSLADAVRTGMLAGIVPL